MLHVEDFRRNGELAPWLELADAYAFAGEIAPDRQHVDVLEVPLAERQRVIGRLRVTQDDRGPQWRRGAAADLGYRDGGVAGRIDQVVTEADIAIMARRRRHLHIALGGEHYRSALGVTDRSDAQRATAGERQIIGQQRRGR